MPGITEVTGNLFAGTMVATFDPSQVTPEQIVQAVENTGYAVEGTFEP
ncbi:MAG: heavy-metal-associated domain-containing protein [Anaerolineae bacterium]|nr:heavy-metal-associated domain-containing protein [Anaerolineae bacterium]